MAASKLRPKRRVLDDGDGGVDLVRDVVGAGHDVELIARDARGPGGAHLAGGGEEGPGVGQVVRVEPVGEEALGVDEVELGLAQAALAVGPEAHEGLDGQDLPEGDGVDRGGVRAEVEDAALGPAVIEDALAVLEVAHGAGLAVPERVQAEHVALVVVVDADLEVGHVGPGGGLGLLGLSGGLVRGVEDGQADRGVGARVLPALEHVEVQGAPDDAVEGRHPRGLAQALEDARVPGAGLLAGPGQALEDARVPGAGPGQALEEQALGRREGEDRLQAAQDVLSGGALLDELQERLDDGGVAGAVRGGHELQDRVLGAPDGPGHGGLHGPELELALAPEAVVGHAHAGLPVLGREAEPGVRVAHERVEHVDARAQDVQLVARGGLGRLLVLLLVRGGRHHVGEAGGGPALGGFQGVGLGHDGGVHGGRLCRFLACHV